jgi:hypothetical protein
LATKEVKHKGVPFVLEVDDEDQEILGKAWWICFKGKMEKGGYYKAKRDLTVGERVDGKRAKKSLHQEVWEKHFGKVPEGHDIDHIDFNTLNNKKCNLRLLAKKDNKPRRKVKEKQNGEPVAQAA